MPERREFSTGDEISFRVSGKAPRWFRVKSFPVLFPDGFHCTAHARICSDPPLFLSSYLLSAGISDL